MIITAKPRISFLWQFTGALTWTTILLQYYLIGAVFIFSLKKFIDNPAAVTFIMSLPAIISLVVNPFFSYMSDRVWTRFGRRKPFVCFSWTMNLVSIALMPLAPNLYALIACYLAFQFFNDIGDKPTEAMKQEIVPPKQRGTAAAMAKWMMNISQMVFMLVAVGRFDDFQFYAGIPIHGEYSLYWSVSIALLVMLLVVALGVKESPIKSKLTGEGFSIVRFFKALLNKNLWPVYILITGYSIGKAGLGALGALLYTEQWGFTKQEMGLNMAIGGVLNIFIILILGIFADRLPRMKTYKILIVLSILLEAAYFAYVELVLFDNTPTLLEVVFFGEMSAVVGILMGLIYIPLVYDYVPRNELGTYAAGATIVDKLVFFATLNGVGIFVAAYSAFFLPPGGERTTIVTDQVYQQEQVYEWLTDEGSIFADKAEDISVEAWYGNNADLAYGRSFEVRFANDDSISKDKKINRLENQRDQLMADRNNAEFLAEKARMEGDEAEAAAQQKEFDESDSIIKELNAQIEDLALTLQARSDAFQSEVDKELQDKLAKPGDQISNAYVQPLVMVDFALNKRPKSEELAKALNALRAERPEVVDMRLRNDGLNFYLEVSLLPQNGGISNGFLEDFGADLVRIANHKWRLDGALVAPAKVINRFDAEAIALDLKVVEDPLNNHPSPIDQVVQKLYGLFADPPQPQRRIWATARGLRELGVAEHVGIYDISDETQSSIRVICLYTDEAATNEEILTDLKTAYTEEAGVDEHLATMLAMASPSAISQAYNLYFRTIDAAYPNRISIARPNINTGFAPEKRDYMSGYTWMIFMSIIGLGVTLLFTRREEKGLVRKRGREESEAEAKAEDERLKHIKEGDEDTTVYYKPGYRGAKLAMVAFGCLVVAVGMIQMGPNLNLLINGEHGQAVATQVVKDKLEGGEEILATDADIRKAEEKFDRSFIFWNEFAIDLGNDEVHNFRAHSGMQLKPAFYLLDKDGLPTTVNVIYDPEDLDYILIPGVWSTWFLPGALVIFGLMAVLVGFVLLYYAGKPIAMPIIVEKGDLEEDAEDAKDAKDAKD